MNERQDEAEHDRGYDVGYSDGREDRTRMLCAGSFGAGYDEGYTAAREAIAEARYG